jgi:hypothetical protein
VCTYNVMTRLVNLLDRFKWPILAIGLFLSAVWLVVVAFGDSLGVSPEAQVAVSKGADALGRVFLMLLAPAVLKDSDNDGTIDLFDEDEDEADAEAD